MTAAAPTRQPLLAAALAFATGILGGVHLWRPPLWWFVAALVFVGAAAWFRSAAESTGLVVDTAGTVHEWRSRIAYASALAALVALGAWCLQASDSAEHLPDLSSFTTGREVIVTAHVIHDGVLHGHGRWQRQSLDLETEQITADQLTAGIAAGVRLSLYAQSATRDDRPENERPWLLAPRVFVYGQRLRFPVKLRQPRNFHNPGAFDFRDHLRREGIVATASVAAEKVEILPGLAGSRWQRWCGRARRSVLERIQALWPRDEAALFDAMLIGERSFIGRDTNAAWQRTGIYHILVVSGMNVGILAFVVFCSLRRLRAGDFVATVLTLLLSTGYVYLAGLGTPVLRSAIMLAVFLMARLLYRDRGPLNALGAAALVLLVADPRGLFDASLQLTFFSVLAIAGLAVPILQRTSEPWRMTVHNLLVTAADISLPPKVAQLRLDLRLLAERLSVMVPLPADKVRPIAAAGVCLAGRAVLLLYETVVVALIAQLAMTLPMAVYFHRATVVGLAANVLAVPLTGVLMSASALALALAYVWSPLAKLPALVASWSLAGITWSVRWLGGMHLSNLRLPTPTLLPTVAFVLALILAMVLVRRRVPLSLAGLIALAATSVWLTVSPARPKTVPGILEVTAIDVGQAESTLVVTPQGRTILVDAAGSLGPWQSDFDFGEDVISPYLWWRGFARLDAVVLTHAHSDHIGGMASIISNFRPRELWLGPNPETAMLTHVKDAIRLEGGRIITSSAGDRIEFGGAEFHVLAPPANWELSPEPRNNDSLVLQVAFGRTAALLTGDIDKKVERHIAGQELRADLLKVAHNGSATSTTREFLAAVRPRLAIIHVGAHNSFGHPRREVLERLGEAHVTTYRTDMSGATTFLLDGNAVHPTTQDECQGRWGTC